LLRKLAAAAAGLALAVAVTLSATPGAQAATTSIATNHYYYLENGHSGLCANVVGESTSNGARVQQYTCKSVYNNDKWEFVPGANENGTEFYYLVNENSGLCANVVGESVLNGALVQQYTCHSIAFNDLWWPEPVAGLTNYYYLVNLHSSLCANVVGESTSNGALVQQYTCGSIAKNDVWLVTDTPV
jgi:hypothetical protein